LEFYFFTTPTPPFANAFRQEYAFQNLKKLRLAAHLTLLVPCGIILLPVVFPVLNQTAHVSFFRGLNICLALASALFLALEHLVLRYGQINHRLWLAQALVLGFCFVFILCCLSITVMAQNNPKNTLTMYLLGLVTVAFLWDFEYYESLLLATCTFLAFGLILQGLQLSLELQILNHCISFLILTCFYVLSRTMYSYRATNFIQLQEIEAKNQEIQKVSRAKSEILGAVAHDLRSPFNNIEMITNLLQKDNLSPAQIRQYHQLILASCQSSRNTINELLYLAKEEQQESIALEKMDLCLLLEEIHQQWLVQLQGSRQLRLNLPPAPLYAALNKERFHRVVDNLLSNAVKFTPAHGEILIHLRQTGPTLLLEIADTGIGIPQKLRGHLFDRFSKARRRGLKGEKSTGLGLSICRELVEKQGGSIQVQSEERQGTTFQITLPVAS
jgi:signal transduction histidine kinase